MATIRAVSKTESLSLSRGWKDYFVCCFMPTPRPSGGGGGGAGPRGPRAPPHPHGLPSTAPGGIIDYGSSKSEYVQVISRSAADDDSDGDEPRANIRSAPVDKGQNKEDGQKTFSTADAKLTSSAAAAGHGTNAAADSNDYSSRSRLNEAEDATSNHGTYKNDSRSLVLDRSGRGRIEEKGELVEKHHASVLLSTPAGDRVGRTSADQEKEEEEDVAGELGNDTFDSHLFDISDLQLDKSPQFGSIRLTLAYDDTHELMTVTVHEAHDIPSQGRGGGANQTQVRMLLLPGRKVRQRTKVKQGENPQFEEALDFKALKDDLRSMGLRIRLYGCERFRRECLIGEAIFAFSSLDLIDPSSPQIISINLEPRNSLSHCDSLSDVSSLAPSESSSSTQSLKYGGTPELMLGLAYNATTGRLSVEVIKGNNFRSIGTKRRPDTYVKMTLTAPNGEELTSSKTSVRRGQANPLFKETFVFHMAQVQLPDVSLLVSVLAQRSLRRKDTIGWFSLGNTSSSAKELDHWNAMLGSRGEQVSRWHTLLEP